MRLSRAGAGQLIWEQLLLVSLSNSREDRQCLYLLMLLAAAARALPLAEAQQLVEEHRGARWRRHSRVRERVPAL